MKFLKLFSLLILMVFLGACQDNEIGNDDPYYIEDSSQIANEDPILETPNEESVLAVELEPIPYLTRNEGNEASVVLIDLVTGEILATYDVEGENAWVSRVFDFNNGYFAALVGVSSQIDLAFRGLIDFDDIDSEREHDYQPRFLIFDQDLNLLETLSIDENSVYAEWINFSRMTDVLIFDDGELLVYFSPISAVFDGNNAYIIEYNLHTGEVKNFATNVREVGEMLFIDSERLFFAHSAFEGENDELGMFVTTYGVLNVLTGEVSVRREEGFAYQQFIATETHVLMSEQDRRWDDVELDNAVMLLNLLTMESQLLSLGEGDSLWAYLSLDVEHVVTISEDLSYFRKYQISSGSLIHEIAIDPMREYIMVGDMRFSFSPVISPITESIYAVSLFIHTIGFSQIHQLVTIP